jgi:hypothetical protein
MIKSVVATLLLAVSSLAYAQANSKVYLDPEDPFSGYFSSALQKKNVPVTVTTDPAQAQYVVKFRANDSNGSLAQGISSAVTSGQYNSGAFNEVTVLVVDSKSKDQVFSYTCKKYNAYSGKDSRMASSVAECLAKHWKDKLH